MHLLRLERIAPQRGGNRRGDTQMTATLVLTVIGRDRPGLVDTLSRTVAEHEGNWLESRMARLAGQFAGILQVAAPEARTADLTTALTRLETQGLTVVVTAANPEPLERHRALWLELLGQDRPGIVREISHALAEIGVSIDELTTETLSGSMSGETLFQASLQLRAPERIALETVQARLESIADELMVDITLDDDNEEPCCM